MPRPNSEMFLCDPGKHFDEASRAVCFHVNFGVSVNRLQTGLNLSYVCKGEKHGRQLTQWISARDSQHFIQACFPSEARSHIAACRRVLTRLAAIPRDHSREVFCTSSLVHNVIAANLLH